MEGTAVKKWHKRKNTAAEGYECFIWRIAVHRKAIPLQALTGPEGSRRMRLPDFTTIGT
jgi:hypothetical protein